MKLLTQVQKTCFGKPEMSDDDDCRACHKYLRLACDLLVDTKIREKEAVWLAERINPAELCGKCTEQCAPSERGLCAQQGPAKYFMKFFDFCACIGGMSLGLEAAGMKCIGQVEKDTWRTQILYKHWPHVPKWGDIYEFDPENARDAELIAGGYPCQPFSLSGKRKGAADVRHIWPRLFEIVQVVRPSWCLFENVVGHVTMGLDTVCADLEGAGFAVQPLVIPACAVDAKHKRARVWILAHSPGNELERRPEASPGGCQRPAEKQLAGFLFSGATASVSRARTYGNTYGFSRRVDEIKRNTALGEACVPQVVEVIGRCIMAAHSGKLTM